MERKREEAVSGGSESEFAAHSLGISVPSPPQSSRDAALAYLRMASGLLALSPPASH